MPTMAAGSSNTPDRRDAAGLARTILGSPWGLVPIVLVAVVLLRHDLGTRPFWHDEAFSMDAVRSGVGGVLRFVTGVEINMSTYYVALALWVGAGGIDDAWVRSLSALFAVLAVVALYGLGRAWLGAPTGLLAAALLGVHAFVIEYGQEARTYTLVLLLSIGSTWLALRAIRRSSFVGWLAYTAVAVAMLYSHVLAFPMLAVHGLMVLTATPRPPIRHLLPAAVVGAALLLPAVLLSAAQQGGVLAWVDPPSIEGIGASITRWTGAGGLRGRPAEAMAVAVLAVAGWGAWQGWRGGGDRRWTAAILVAWAVVPVAALLAVSIVRPVFVTRYLIEVVPAICLLAACGALAIPGRLARPLVIAGLLVVTLVGTVTWYGSVARPDWRGATAYLLEHATRADRIVFFGDGGRVPNHYADQAGRLDDLPLKLWRDLGATSPDVRGTLGATAETLAREGRVLWVIELDDDRVDPTRDPRFELVWPSMRLDTVVPFDRLVIRRFVPRT